MKMSISLPEFTVTSKQFFTASDGSQTELRVFDNKLYITRVVNGVVEGGTLLLDPLPPEATLGAYGEVTSANAVTGEYTLAVNYDDYTEAEREALALQLQAELEAQFPNTSISVTITEGSIKAAYTIVPEDVSTWDMTAASAALDTNRKTMLKNAAAGAGLTQLADDIENDVVVATSSVVPQLASQVLPGLVKSVSFADGTLTIVTIGSFASMKYSTDDGASFTSLTPAASGSSHTVALAEAPSAVRVQLFNSGGTKIAQALATLGGGGGGLVFHWPLTTDGTALVGGYDLPIAPGDVQFIEWHGRQIYKRVSNNVYYEWIPISPGTFASGITIAEWRYGMDYYGDGRAFINGMWTFQFFNDSDEIIHNIRADHWRGNWNGWNQSDVMNFNLTHYLDSGTYSPNRNDVDPVEFSSQYTYSHTLNGVYGMLHVPSDEIIDKWVHLALTGSEENGEVVWKWIVNGVERSWLKHPYLPHQGDNKPIKDVVTKMKIQSLWFDVSGENLRSDLRIYSGALSPEEIKQEAGIP